MVEFWVKFKEFYLIQKKKYFANYKFILLVLLDLAKCIFEKDFTGINHGYPLLFPCLTKYVFEINFETK